MTFAALLCTTDAQAQRRYQPRRPTFSPYHDYFRQDTGLLDQYNTFVVPRRRLTSDMSQMQGTIDSQQAEIDSLNRQLLQINGTLAGPTGKAGTFMNYGRYYPGSSGGRRRR
jgi:hypothetical protein